MQVERWHRSNPPEQQAVCDGDIFTPCKILTKTDVEWWENSTVKQPQFSEMGTWGLSFEPLNSNSNTYLLYDFEKII